MNKTQKNIVLVGFSKPEIRSINIPTIGKNYYLNSIEDAKLHQGYLLIINNKDNTDIVSFDKKYRKIINKYANVWIYNENYKESYHKWSNIRLVNRDIFLIDILNFWDEYDIYKEKLKFSVKLNYTKKRVNNIEKIYNYLKDYQTIKTNKIVKDLKINERMVQRYMHNINQIYHNIGYDYSNNEWYIIK